MQQCEDFLSTPMIMLLSCPLSQSDRVNVLHSKDNGAKNRCVYILVCLWVHVRM